MQFLNNPGFNNDIIPSSLYPSLPLSHYLGLSLSPTSVAYLYVLAIACDDEAVWWASSFSCVSYHTTVPIEQLEVTS